MLAERLRPVQDVAWYMSDTSAELPLSGTAPSGTLRPHEW